MALRLLSNFEINLVAGGLEENPEIIVIGGGGGFGPGDVFTNPGSNPGGNNGGEGGDGHSDGDGNSANQPSYQTPGASHEANNFADRHIYVAQKSEALDRAWHATHDALAKVYDLAKQSPSVDINIGHNQHITASQAFSIVDRTNFQIVANSGMGSSGLTTVGVGGYYIGIDPTANGRANPSVVPNVTGINYVIFHEIGHTLNHAFNTSAYADQASANTAGRSLEIALGYTLHDDPFLSFN